MEVLARNGVIVFRPSPSICDSAGVAIIAHAVRHDGWYATPISRDTTATARQVFGLSDYPIVRQTADLDGLHGCGLTTIERCWSFHHLGHNGAMVEAWGRPLDVTNIGCYSGSRT